MCGLNNPKIQNKLLNTEDLTFKKACQIAKSMEMAEKNTQEFRPVSARDDTQGIVNKLGTVNTNESLCYRCGGKHAAQKCKFKSAKCYKYGKNVQSSVKPTPQGAKGNVNALESSRA